MIHDPLEAFLRDAEVATRLNTTSARDDFILSLADRATYEAYAFEIDCTTTRIKMRALRDMFLVESLARGYCTEKVMLRGRN